ncbi:MAG: multidrug efflux system membrane fusion protein [Yoonia sp.]|jgi:multidrug efflux system membrane fusion protein
MANQTADTTLSFDTERGASQSKWVAGLLLIGVAVWMGSGFVPPAEDEVMVTPIDSAVRLISVAVAPSQAETVTQYFVAEGQALPDRMTSIRAESTGQIAEVIVEKGELVGAGQLIARFDVTRNEADLTRAQEELARAQRDFDNSVTLVERGVATNDTLSENRAALASAKAAVINAEQSLANSEITAPFAGRLEALNLNAGEFVSAGSEVGQIVDNTPLSVTIQVPQQSLRNIKSGQEAKVTFITGEVRDGVVAFVGTSADAATRTFLAEITVQNEDGQVPAGVSAEIRIPTGEAVAHFMSPATLSLGSDGTLGVKTVNADNVVVFSEVKIERAQTDGIWVSGLPANVDIITIGQGYVNNGQTVDPQPEATLTAEASQ